MNMQLANRDAGAVQRTDNPYDRLRGQLVSRVDDFRMVLPAHISPEKFQRTVMTAVQSNPELLKADRASFITACMKAAQDGLLPDGREAALVTFNTRKKDSNGNGWNTVVEVQYMPMVYGLRKKILQSGEIKDIQTAVVYRQEIEAGLFVYEEGTERTLRHKPLLDPSFEPTDDDIAAAYSIATYEDGSFSFEVMRRSDINKVRQASKTGAVGREYQGKPIPPKGPWVDWFPEMARKTVMRRHSKTLPMSGDLIDVEAMEEVMASRSATALLASVDADPPVVVPGREDLSQIAYDSETGEVLDDDAAAARDDALDHDSAPKQEAKPAKAKPKKSPGQPSETSPPAGQSQPSSAESEAADDNKPATDDNQQGGNSDQWDIWLDDVRQKLMQADTIPDLNSTWSNLRKDLEAAPADIAGSAEASFTTRLKALKEAK